MPTGVYEHKKMEYPAALVDDVHRMYYDLGMSQDEIAATVGFSQRVVWRLMKNHGMKTRPQVKRHQSGDANSSWRGDRAGYQARQEIAGTLGGGSALSDSVVERESLRPVVLRGLPTGRNDTLGDSVQAAGRQSGALGRDYMNCIPAELYHHGTVVNQDVNNGHLVVCESTASAE